jgi:hypothetical protein
MNTALNFRTLPSASIPSVRLVEPTYPNESKVDLAVEHYFKHGSVTVEGTLITSQLVSSEIDMELNQVSELLEQGKDKEASELNYELRTNAAKSLVIDALASA